MSLQGWITCLSTVHLSTPLQPSASLFFCMLQQVVWANDTEASSCFDYVRLSDEAVPTLQACGDIRIADLLSDDVNPEASESICCGEEERRQGGAHKRGTGRGSGRALHICACRGE